MGMTDNWKALFPENPNALNLGFGQSPMSRRLFRVQFPPVTLFIFSDVSVQFSASVLFNLCGRSVQFGVTYSYCSYTTAIIPQRSFPLQPQLVNAEHDLLLALIEQQVLVVPEVRIAAVFAYEAGGVGVQGEFGHQYQ